jgi:flagellar biosynthesis regulator FlaF
MSYAAYAKIQQVNESGRDLEIRAISHITRQLIDGNKPDAKPLTRIRALNGNIRLWTLLLNELLNPGNGLPESIKTSYIRLGRFARRTSVKALTRKQDLSILIRINTDVLDALHQQRAAA